MDISEATWPRARSHERRATVLVVDAVAEDRARVGSLLEEAGYRVRAADNAHQALRFVAHRPAPDLILLATGLPGMDGLELLRRLRDGATACDVPVMLLCPNERPVDVELGLALGAADYLGKPLQPLLALARVRNLLQARRARGPRGGPAAPQGPATGEGDGPMSAAASLRAMLRMAELRDPEIGRHLRRSQAFLGQLALALREQPHHAAALDADTVDRMAAAAALHDVGKVAIPDHILHSASALSPEQWTIVRSHTTVGARAIEHARAELGASEGMLELAAQIALSHHERWDGRGYPHGLAGTAIPLAARLMAVADAFDAITSARLYRRALSFEQARAVILGEAGGCFDPDVVRAFDGCFAQLVAVAEEPPEPPPVPTA